MRTTLSFVRRPGTFFSEKLKTAHRASLAELDALFASLQHRAFRGSCEVSAFAPRFTITNAITAGLTAIERARGFLEAATLSDEWVRRMSQRALLLEAHHTTHIEGTHLTIEQAERLWAGQPVAEAQADDVRELLNYREAFNLVSEYLESGEPVTEGLIREIHKRLVDGVRGGQGGPGAYRTVQNYVVNSRTREVIYTPPPPEDVPPLMRELVAWLRAESAIHPVLVAGIAQFQLVHIHPFLDGNGRTSRLLSTLCLYRVGLRLQAPVHAERVLRSRPPGVLPGDSECARAGHGPDRLAGVLRRWPGDPARRGRRERQAGHVHGRGRP